MAASTDLTNLLYKLRVLRVGLLVLKAFDPKQVRDARGRWTRGGGGGGGSSGSQSKEPKKKQKRGKSLSITLRQALKTAVPELKHYEVDRKQQPRGRFWLLASTEKSKFGGHPVTTPGDDTATGIAVKVSSGTKHIYFSELNSKIPTAGRRMVEAVINAAPSDFTFGATDWSRSSRADPDAPKENSFWDRMKTKYPGRFRE